MLLESLPSVLVLPRESVAMQNGQPVVEVLQKGHSEIRTIKIGPMNDCEVVIASGLDEGTIVSRAPRLTTGAKTPE